MHARGNAFKIVLQHLARSRWRHGPRKGVSRHGLPKLGKL